MTPSFHQARSVRLEWWAVVAALALLVGAIATREWLWRADQLLYDVALAVWQRPAPQDIVIVAIDDRSLTQVGRWPWRRAVHATLINRLTEDGAKAVGLDLLLSDRDATDAASDASLAEAMLRSKRVVLPLVLAPTDRPELDDQLPLPELAKAAAQLGFAHVVIDADGIVRRMSLREIRNGEELSSFALRVLAVAATPAPTTLRRSSRAPLRHQASTHSRCPLPARQGTSAKFPMLMYCGETCRLASFATRSCSSAQPLRAWSADTQRRFRG